MGTIWQRRKIDIPKKYGPDEREAIADRVLEYLRQRSEAGHGPGNKPWSGSKGKYSKAYMESLDFKIAGKSKGKVDLTLTVDMLIEMDLISHKSGQIRYGYENGTEENGKADGNIRGTYGTSSANAKKARDFLTLKPAEIKAIIAQLERERRGR